MNSYCSFSHSAELACRVPGLGPTFGQLALVFWAWFLQQKCAIISLIDADSRSVREAFEVVLSLWFVEVLVYNADQPVSWLPTNFTDICRKVFCGRLDEPSPKWERVIPGMVERGKGTILFTGCSASLNGIFALRSLSQCLAREFQPQGVHIAHVMAHLANCRRPSTSSCQRTSVGEQQQQSIVGEVMDPDSLAQTYWHMRFQDQTAWTLEIDLRPSNSHPQILLNSSLSTAKSLIILWLADIYVVDKGFFFNGNGTGFAWMIQGGLRVLFLDTHSFHLLLNFLLGVLLFLNNNFISFYLSFILIKNLSQGKY
ncbi:hypothetical protein P3X46_012464 [Hevea brasiliensis]|uniref:Uncharacterized protein n=1 Tax=Hevea brasiliensis TaxID=3981 RepID=A0ABQ9MAA7_HEVBR|nr:hypothetical protein P3X46_012464 [Hevea brasiliensis]